jgi:hypothetical protein
MAEHSRFGTIRAVVRARSDNPELYLYEMYGVPVRHKIDGSVAQRLHQPKGRSLVTLMYPTDRLTASRGHADDWTKQRERYQTVLFYGGQEQYKLDHRVVGASW